VKVRAIKRRSKPPRISTRSISLLERASYLDTTCNMLPDLSWETIHGFYSSYLHGPGGRTLKRILRQSEEPSVRSFMQELDARNASKSASLQIDLVLREAAAKS
jgi:hypothetical protein